MEFDGTVVLGLDVSREPGRDEYYEWRPFGVLALRPNIEGWIEQLVRWEATIRALERALEKDRWEDFKVKDLINRAKDLVNRAKEIEF